MGSLSNLYISQSYQSLIHLGSDTTITTASVQLQDGAGNGTGVFVNSLGNVFLSGSLTASLQQGYVWVGDVNNRTKLVATSSFIGGGTDLTSLNAFTASQETKDATLANVTASLNASTASQQSQINSLIAFTSSQDTKNSTLSTYTASVDSSLTNINSFTASNGNTSLNSYTASNDTKWSTLGGQTGSYVTSAITASSLVTASFDNGTRNLTFTKGNTTQFSVNIPDVSGSGIPTGTVSSSAQIVAYNIFATTGSNQFIGNQAIDGTLTITGKLIGSQSLILQPNANDARTLEIYNTSPADTHITASGGELFLGNDETYVLVNTNANQKLVVIRGDEKIVASGSLDISGSLTSSLQQGYVLVGNSNNRTQLVATSSFGSTINTGSFATTGSNTFVGNQTINGNLNLTGSLTASGLFYPTTAGTAGQFMTTNGTNTLSFDDVHVILEAVRYGENITLGDPLYVSGSNGTTPIVYKADAAITSKMPVIYIANSTAVANTNTTALTLGLITGVTTTGYPEGTTIYVAEGGGWSSSRPSGSASIVQPLGIVTKEGPGGSGRGLILNPGPATLPNLQTGYAWVGNAGNQPIAVATSSFAENTNLTSLNAFTASQETKNSTLGSLTGSFATTGSNVFIGNQTISGSFDTTGSLATFKVAAFNVQDNTGVNKFLVNNSSALVRSLYPLEVQATFTASLAQGYVWVGNASNVSTLVATSSFATTTSNNFIGNQTITGSLILSSSAAIELQVIGNSVFTGSVAGNVVSASITSNTASIDFNLANYFEVTSSVTPLRLNITNITPGTTSTLIISASASSSITFSTNVAQPTGSAYSGSLGSIDILSLVAFNTSKVNLVSTKALV
jgi:hypothetical protein